MGSKRLKAIVIDPTDGPGVHIADEALFKQGQAKMRDALMTHP